jgi:hypothetical protein
MSIEVMKQALEALKLHLTHHEHGCVYLNPVMRAIEAELAKPEQEPVAWMNKDGWIGLYKQGDATTPLYTAPQKYCPSENNAAYEKGFVEGMAKQMHSSVDRAVNAMAKKWVGLTELEVKHYNSRLSGSGVAQEIEAKLKEKNGG